MQPDPGVVAETRAWFHKASKDLATAAFELTADPPFVEDVVFHAQQAVEKALKAFLTWHGREFRKTHNLVELGRSCAVLDSSLEAQLRAAAPLTEYAWRFRYPGDPEEPSIEEARQALAVARDVFVSLTSRVPEDVRR